MSSGRSDATSGRPEVASGHTRASMARRLAVSGLLLYGIGAGFASIDRASPRSPATPAMPAKPVASARVLPIEVVPLQASSSYSVNRLYPGVIIPRRRVSPGFKLKGVIAETFVGEGDRLIAGQGIARLLTRDLKSRLDQVRARLAQAEALLDRYQAGARPQERAAAAADVDRLEAEVEHARRDRVRQEDLLARRVVSREAFDTSHYSLKARQAALERARQVLAELEAGTREETLRHQAAVVAELEARRAEVEHLIEDCLLRAPFAGTVTRVHGEAGTAITEGQPVVEMVEDGVVEAWFGLPTGVALALTEGSPITFIAHEHDPDHAQRITGRVKTHIRDLDPRSRTIRLIVQVEPGDQDRLIPNQVVRLETVRTLQGAGFWVPTSSLTRGLKGLWALLRVGGSPGEEVLRRELVEVLHTEGTRTYVRGTLRTGDRVLARGTHRVVAGQRVDPRTVDLPEDPP